MAHLVFDGPLLPEAPMSATYFVRATNLPIRCDLPTPAEVRVPGRFLGIVLFEDLGIYVKFGDPSRVKIEEAQAMRAISQTFPNHQIPVPELYAFRVFERLNFIYMSLIPGLTMKDC